MRAHLLLLPLVMVAAPAAAQPAPAREDVQIPRELTDPAMVDRLAEAMKAMSSAFLELPVGEVQAAVEGREPTAADKRRTVRSEAQVSERELRQQIEQSKPIMQAGMKALAEALPAMMRGMAEAREAMERAAANMPRPDYPKR